MAAPSLFNHPENGSIGGAGITPPPPPSAAMAAASRATAFKPGIVAILGIVILLFSVTFLLLLYIKHWKRSSYGDTATSRNYYYPPSRRNSGIDGKVIASLPMFRFSSLLGQKDGLECAVCLNRFEAEEVLRLLPKCKHAFHVECIDTWLEAHSTCPLCRYRVDAEDVLLVMCNQSGQITPRGSGNGKGGELNCPRVSGRHSSAGERGSALEIIVENRGNDFRGRISLDSWNSRRKTGGSESGKAVDGWKSFRRKSGNDPENPGRKSRASRKDGQLPVIGDRHRLEHRIIVSGEGERRRWSDVEAADLLYLKSEMLLGGSGRGVINERSVSEITGMSRYRSNNGGKEGRGEREEERERVVKRWLAWISQSQQQIPAVHSATSSSSIPS